MKMVCYKPHTYILFKRIRKRIKIKCNQTWIRSIPRWIGNARGSCQASKTCCVNTLQTQPEEKWLKKRGEMRLISNVISASFFFFVYDIFFRFLNFDGKIEEEVNWIVSYVYVTLVRELMNFPFPHKIDDVVLTQICFCEKYFFLLFLLFLCAIVFSYSSWNYVFENGRCNEVRVRRKQIIVKEFINVSITFCLWNVFIGESSDFFFHNLICNEAETYVYNWHLKI